MLRVMLNGGDPSCGNIFASKVAYLTGNVLFHYTHFNGSLAREHKRKDLRLLCANNDCISSSKTYRFPRDGTYKEGRVIQVCCMFVHLMPFLYALFVLRSVDKRQSPDN